MNLSRMVLIRCRNGTPSRHCRYVSMSPGYTGLVQTAHHVTCRCQAVATDRRSLYDRSAPDDSSSQTNAADDDPIDQRPRHRRSVWRERGETPQCPAVRRGHVLLRYDTTDHDRPARRPVEQLPGHQVDQGEHLRH